MFTTTQIIITIIASVSSGLVGVLFNYKKEKKREQIRQAEKMHDGLLLELKDLQIKLYKLEKDLDEWKQKYYEALQELISVKADLDRSLSMIDHMDMHIDMDIEHE
jgi:septal ring factor EnvC (AmiA/AmiB activator)